MEKKNKNPKDPILLEVILYEIRFSCNQNIGERFLHIEWMKLECLITGKSSFDGKKSGQLVRVAFVKKLLLTELGL